MKHFRRKKLLIILAILILAFLIFLVYMAVREQRRHDQLSNSIDALQVSLEQHGIQAEKSTGCGRPYAEIGRGYKSCSVQLSYKVQAVSVDKADMAMSAYAESLSAVKDFKSSEPLPYALPGVKNGIDFGTYYYSYPGARIFCGVSYYYQAKNANFQINFSCDDTSWFVRTFENIL